MPQPQRMSRPRSSWLLCGGSGVNRHRGKPILAWLFGIAAHAIVDHQRASGRQRRLLDRLLPSKASSQPDRQLLTISGEDDRLAEHLDLVNAIERLSNAQREVMVLRYFVGLTTGEIAEILGKDSSGVYSLHARALIALRARLSEDLLRKGDESGLRRAIYRAEA